MHNIGDVVILKADSPYEASAFNPKHSSEYFCIGTVIKKQGDFYYIRWENGNVVVYGDKDIALFKSNKKKKMLRRDMRISRNFKLPAGTQMIYDGSFIKDANGFVFIYDDDGKIFNSL